MNEVEKVLAEVAREHVIAAQYTDTVEGIEQVQCSCGWLGPEVPRLTDVNATHAAHLAHEQAKAIEARVRPSVGEVMDHLARSAGVFPSWWAGAEFRAMAEYVLAMLPGRTEAEVKAEALREAANQIEPLAEADCLPDPDHWLRDRANQIEGRP